MTWGLAQKLLVLLQSGVSLYDALILLRNIHRHQYVGYVFGASKQTRICQQMLDELVNGMNDLVVCRYLFPWWCVFPFQQMNVSVSIDSFLDGYIRYYDRKKSLIIQVQQQLMYPSFLLFVSVGLVFICRWVLWPILRPLLQINHNGISDDAMTWFIFGIIIAILICFCWIVRVVLIIFRFNMIDMIEMVSLSLSQGWCLDDCFEGLIFPSYFQSKWLKTYDQTIEIGCFSQAFCQVFKLNSMIYYVLHSFESNGQLSAGLIEIMSLVSDDVYCRILHKIKMIQLILYVIVIVSILYMLLIFYSPLLFIDV